MKKRITFCVATFLLFMTAGFTACGLTPESTDEPKQDNPTGLEFVEVDGGYAVAGIGTCEDYDVKIPETYNGKDVVAVAENAFAFVDGVTKITVPASVKTIETKAFSACTHLATVTLENGVTTIGNEAFSLCSALETVTLGETVETIGDKAFYTCERLKELTVPDSVKRIGMQAFYQNTRLQTLTLGTGLEYIGESAFAYCDKLPSVEIPDGAPAQICDQAFFECRGLRSIYIGDAAMNIGVEAFDMCTKADFLTIGDSVNTIGEKAFEACRNLIKVTLGESVREIGNGAFYNCYKLVEVYNRSQLVLEKNSTNGRIGYHPLNIYAQEGGSKVTIDENGCILYVDGTDVKLMGHTTNRVIELVVPDSVTEIPKMAFYNNTYISSVIAGENLKKIGAQAFHFAYNVRTASCVGVESIESQAFSHCNKMIKITLGKNLQTVQENAFEECEVLSYIDYTGLNDNWLLIDIESGNDRLKNATRNYI